MGTERQIRSGTTIESASTPDFQGRFGATWQRIFGRAILGMALLVWAAGVPALAQSVAETMTSATATQSAGTPRTPEEWNARLADLVHSAPMSKGASSAQDFRIGYDDQLAITVLEAPELSQSVRVTASGEISLPLIGVVKVGGLTPREVEAVLQELLRRTYMKDPQVSVQVTQIRSRAISVLGAVQKPGVYEVTGSKSLLEVLSMAGGLAPDAGSTVIVMPPPNSGVPPSSVTPGQPASVPAASSFAAERAGADTHEIDLRSLLQSGDAKFNVQVDPGEIVKVKQAGMVYVVGEFLKPGGFPLTNNEKLTVLQAVSLGGGLSRTAAKGSSLIIRTTDDGQRKEIPIDLSKILKGKSPDIALQPRDIVFVPNSKTKTAGQGAAAVLARMVYLRAVIW